ncbi:MAG: RNA methyltransferase [Candidatus Hodarchaeota archaeon]
MKIRVVLARPNKPENVGLIARVMKNLGFNELCVVNPYFKDPQTNFGVRTTARHAEDIIDNMQICYSLPEALENIHYTIGTTARKGGDNNVSRTAVFPEEIGDFSSLDGNIAILFGSEPSGLSNEEIAFSDLIITIPCSPDYSSMNLASAAAIILYFISRKLKLASGISKKHRLSLPHERAILYQHFEDVLVKINHKPRKRHIAVQIFKNIISRNYTSSREVHNLIGVIKRIKSQLASLSPQETNIGGDS